VPRDFSLTSEFPCFPWVCFVKSSPPSLSVGHHYPGSPAVLARRSVRNVELALPESVRTLHKYNVTQP